MTLLGAVELGGTKIRAARGDPAGTIADSVTFPTGLPDQAFARLRAFFQAGEAVSAIGIGSFGPIGVTRGAADWGVMGRTPKPGWQGADVGGALAALGVPVRLETDVAAAGLGEHRRGALAGTACGIYLTVGTGIGGALILDGRPVNGAAHAEMGHVTLLREARDEAPSTCPHHPHCAEGLAAGPAIARRFGHTLSDPQATADQRALIADYLGQLVANLVLVLSPERIVIGGGVAKAPGLLPAVQARMRARLNDYLSLPALDRPGFIAPPALGDDAGLTGALFLAAEASGHAPRA
mgnify:CR=1 FL=1